MHELEALAKPFTLLQLFHLVEFPLQVSHPLVYGSITNSTDNLGATTMFMVVKHLRLEVFASQLVQAVHTIVQLVIVGCTTFVATCFAD